MKNKGFTLIEVVIIVLVLAAVAIPIYKGCMKRQNPIDADPHGTASDEY